MTEEKRGKNVAIFGTVLQTAVTVAMLAMWMLTNSLAAMVCMWLLAGGVLLWLMVTMLFYCRQLAAQEEAELEEIAARGPVGTIFEGEDGVALRPAAGRLAGMERWVVPIFTLLWATGHAVVGALTIAYLARLDKPLTLVRAGPAALFAVLIAFMSFLFSRYCTGLGTRKQWRLLRATGSYLLVNVLLIVGVLMGLLAATQKHSVVDLLVAYVAPVVQLILAIELTLNVILDFYRPRVPGQEQRPPLDSRLFNLVAQPGRVGHTIAETLNYQFGFEVSKTWFYQLLSRAFVPLVILGVVVMFLMSAIVIVPEGNEGVLLHFGRRADETIKPGISMKWPWPIDRVEMFDTGQVYEVVLGTGEEGHGEDEVESMINGRRMALWTSEHSPEEGHAELDFLVAVPPRTVDTGAAKDGQARKLPSVEIIKLVIPVQYRIRDPLKFGYVNRKGHALLEKAAYREMVKYCASATLTNPAGQEGRPEAIMTYGRQRAGEELKKRIQKATDKLGLGVEVLTAGLVGVHPPAEVAPEFEKVLQAERARDTRRYEAQGKANALLAAVAGTPDDARKLALAIRAYRSLQQLAKPGDSPAGQAESLAAYISRVTEDLDGVDREIGQEKSFGRNSPAQEAYRAELARYLDLLKRVGKEGAAFDYAGELAKARQLADARFDSATGQPAELVAKAQAYRWTTELAERGRAETLRYEMLAYRSNPRVYKFERWLDVWNEVLVDVTKYVLAVDRDTVEIRLNLEKRIDPMAGSITGGDTGQ